MDQLLQQFEKPIEHDGESYAVFVFGRDRPGDTWQGWLVFERRRDGKRFTTPVETTQPDGRAVIYWATGLSGAYFDGALHRAMQPAPERVADVVHPEGLAHVETDVVDFFARHGVTRALTEALFNEIPHAHADVVRALEDLEKQGRMLLRRTEAGNDWVYLTDLGLRAAVPAAPPKPAR